MEFVLGSGWLAPWYPWLVLILVNQKTESQGRINGQISLLIDQPQKMKEFMEGKTEKQKKAGRKHLIILRKLRGRA